MIRCKYCNEKIVDGEEFQDPKYKGNKYCNEEHWKKFEAQKKQNHYKPQPKKATSESKPKNKPKPKSKVVTAPSDRRKLTDYIDSIWPVEPNWKWFASQIENLTKTTGISYDEMRITLRYCTEFLEMKADDDFGLQQFIPKYTQEALDFQEQVKDIKSNCSSIDFEDEVTRIPISRAKPRRILKEDLSLES